MLDSLQKQANLSRTGGAACERFDEVLYYRRNLIEMVFPVEKLVFGDVNHSQSNWLSHRSEVKM